MNRGEKPVVGQTLYSLNVGNAARRAEQVLTPATVTKVGRKYFTCVRDGWNFGEEYHIEDWCEKTEYTASSYLYATEKEWIDEKERNELHKTISEYFSIYGPSKKNMSLKMLRQIKELLER